MGDSTHAGAADREVLEFHDHGDRTRMTFSDSPYPPEGRGRAEAGWSVAFEKLAAVVAG